MPYRSTGVCPHWTDMASNTAAGRAALPETSSRAGRRAAAAAGSAQIRDHTVGTPK